MKPTPSVIGLESLWIVVTVLLECIQKESWIDWSELGAMTPVKNQGQCGSCWAYSMTEGIESTIYMAEGALPELAVQQITSCDKTLGECQGEDLPTAFDHVQNTDDGIDRDSDYPQASNVKGKTGHCECDGNQVASVTSWNYSVPSCTGGACDNQDAAAFATVVAKREQCSVDLCEHCILGSVHKR